MSSLCFFFSFIANNNTTFDASISELGLGGESLRDTRHHFGKEFVLDDDFYDDESYGGGPAIINANMPAFQTEYHSSQANVPPDKILLVVNPPSGVMDMNFFLKSDNQTFVITYSWPGFLRCAADILREENLDKFFPKLVAVDATLKSLNNESLTDPDKTKAIHTSLPAITSSTNTTKTVYNDIFGKALFRLKQKVHSDYAVTYVKRKVSSVTTSCSNNESGGTPVSVSRH